MRSVVYRFDDLPQFLGALDASRGQALPAPDGTPVRDGEWVLALFEFHRSSRATAAAARGVARDDGPALVFERRDWERLRSFARAPSTTRLAAVVPERPRDLGTTAAWERSRSADEGPPTEPDPEPRKPPPPHILLCDDDPDLREIVAAMLEAIGLAVDSVGSAEEALDFVRRTRPDLVLLDWNLPGMSGVELCKLLRADAELSRLPVLFLTAHTSTQDVVEAFAAGADDYVAKPFRAPELGARIFGLLRRTRGIVRAP